MIKKEQYKTTIAEELSSFSNSQDLSWTSLFDKIYGYYYRDYTANYADFSSFIKDQTNIYFDLAIKQYKKSLQLNSNKKFKPLH